MKTLFALAVAIVGFAAPAAAGCDHSDIESYLSEAENYARYARDESDLDNANDYARMALNEIENAQFELSNCN